MFVKTKMIVEDSIVSDNARAALVEDVGKSDITAMLIPKTVWARAQVITREKGIVCGIPWFNEVFNLINTDVQLEWKVQEGSAMIPDQPLCEIKGPASALLTAERSALNFLQTLSGTATLVHQYVAQLKGTKAKLLDTRKTIPGLRYAQKYAVRIGGGENHRMGLYDAYLIKENHISVVGSISAIVKEARKKHPDKLLEVEVENKAQLQEALGLSVSRILLDNFTLDAIKEAVELANGKAELEVSGNMTLDNIGAVAATGVDYISVGSVTKHVRSLDMSLRIINTPEC